MLSTATNSCDESSSDEEDFEEEISSDEEDSAARPIFIGAMLGFIIAHMFFVVSWPRISACATFVFVSLLLSSHSAFKVLLFVSTTFLLTYALYERNLYVFFSVNSLHILYIFFDYFRPAILFSALSTISACFLVFHENFFQYYYERATILFVGTLQILFIYTLHTNVQKAVERKSLLAQKKAQAAQTFEKYSKKVRQCFPSSIVAELLDDSQKKYIAYEKANCSLLVAHIGGLDEIALVQPKKSFQLFDAIVQEFDAIVDFYRLEKVGTFHQYKYIVCEKLDYITTTSSDSLAEAALQMRNFLFTLSLYFPEITFQAALVRGQVAGVYDRRFSTAQNFELWGAAYESGISLMSKCPEYENPDFIVLASFDFVRKLLKKKFKMQKCYDYVCLIDFDFDFEGDDVDERNFSNDFWSQLLHKFDLKFNNNSKKKKRRVFVSEFDPDCDSEEETSLKEILDEVDYNYVRRFSQQEESSKKVAVFSSDVEKTKYLEQREKNHMGWFELAYKPFCCFAKWPYVTYKSVALDTKQQECYLHDNSVKFLATHFCLLFYYTAILLIDVGIRLHLNLHLFSAQHVVFLLFVFGVSIIFIGCTILFLGQVRRVNSAKMFHTVLICTLCALLPAVHLCIAAPFTEVNEVFFGLLISVRHLSFALFVFSLFALVDFHFVLVFVTATTCYGISLVENAWLKNVVSVNTVIQNQHDWLALFALDDTQDHKLMFLLIFMILAIKMATQKFVLQQGYFLLSATQMYAQIAEQEQKEIALLDKRRLVRQKKFLVFCCIDQQEYESFRQIFGAQHEKCTRFFDELQQTFSLAAKEKNVDFTTAFHGVYIFTSNSSKKALQMAESLQPIIDEKMLFCNQWLPAGVDSLHTTVIVHELKCLFATAPGTYKIGTHVWDVSIDQCFLLLFYLSKQEDSLLVCTQQVAEKCSDMVFTPYLSVDLYEEDDRLMSHNLATYTFQQNTTK